VSVEVRESLSCIERDVVSVAYNFAFMISRATEGMNHNEPVLSSYNTPINFSPVTVIMSAGRFV